MMNGNLKCCRVLLFMIGLLLCAGGKVGGTEYVVLVGKNVQADREWKKVVDKLVEIHQAQVVGYGEFTSEALSRLKELAPRYVAIVEKPERINRQFVIDLNQMSRKVDDDIYTDFLWGIITGYDADAALALVERARTPKEVRSAWCLRNDDFRDGKYFEKMGLCDQGGVWYEKNGEGDTVSRHVFEEQAGMSERMVRWVETAQPDLIVYQVEELGNRMPLLQGTENEGEIVFPREGKLWLGDRRLKPGGGSRVYFAQMSGGRTHTTRESIPVAWMNDGSVTAFVGSTTFSFHGCGTWGTLKYWLTDAGRFTLAEAYFLNQQDVLWHLNEWESELLYKPCQYSDDRIKMVRLCYGAYSELQEKEPNNPALIDKFGYWYERDIWVYYGDPLWDVRVKDLSHDRPYTITTRTRGKKCVVTIKVSADYTWDRLCGELFSTYGMGDLHCAVGNLPICFFFPERLRNPRVATSREMNWDISVNKDFLFIRNAFLEPGKTYRIELDVDK